MDAYMAMDIGFSGLARPGQRNLEAEYLPSLITPNVTLLNINPWKIKYTQV